MGTNEQIALYSTAELAELRRVKRREKRTLMSEEAIAEAYRLYENGADWPTVALAADHSIQYVRAQFVKRGWRIRGVWECRRLRMEA